MKSEKRAWHDLAEITGILADRVTELTPREPFLKSLVWGLVSIPRMLAGKDKVLGNSDRLVSSGVSWLEDHEVQRNLDRLLDGDSQWSKQYNSVEPITPSIRDHPGFQWLENQEDIQRALRSFLCQLRTKELPEWLLNIREVQFYHAAALCGGMARNPDFKPTIFSKDDKRQAVKNANNLKTQLDSGIWRSRYSEGTMLTDLLTRFIEDLESPGPREYSGPADRERYALETTCACFLIFELGSRASVARIVAEIGAAYGIALSQRTYERYAAKAHSQQ